MARRIRIAIHPVYQEALSQQGMKTYDDFMQVQSDDFAARSRTTSSVRLPLLINGEQKTVYLKRYWYPSPLWKYIFRPSRACVEQGNLVWLKEHGLPVPEWIAWGEERGALHLKSCWIMTLGIPDTQNLDEFLPTLPTSGMTSDDLLRKRRAIGELADFVRAMHTNSYIDHDLHFRNVLIRRNGNGHYHFAFIDSPKGRVARGQGLRRGILHDLACLNKYAGRYLTKTDVLRFYMRYRNAGQLDLRDRLNMDRIEAISERMRGKSQRKREQEAAQ